MDSFNGDVRTVLTSIWLGSHANHKQKTRRVSVQVSNTEVLEVRHYDPFRI